MPRRSVRNRKRAIGGLLSFLIGALSMAALALICAIVVVRNYAPAGREQSATTPQMASDSFVDINDLPDTDLVLMADSFSDEYLPSATEADATPEPVEATPTPAPLATLSPAGLGGDEIPTAPREGLLPIYSRGSTGKKTIAVTVDECSDLKMMNNFITVAKHFNAKLTLFPTGEAIMRSGMAEVLKTCLFTYGYEIENRGYTASTRLYQCSDNQMVQQIWKQSVALNYVLGSRYEPHFYRLYGGIGESDPRTHAFLEQQGYLGIAHWTVSCSNLDVKQVPDKLMPGGVYVFRATQEDGQRMYALMSAAQDQGYEMVTMNQLFGLPENTCTPGDDSLLSETMPEFKYDNALYDLLPGEASWAVTLLQQRLITLGYLPIKNGADGIYGDNTSVAVRAFQANVGLLASGVADVATQEKLYTPEAPRNTDLLTDLFPTAVPQDQAGLKVEEGLLASYGFDGAEPEESEEPDGN